MTTTTTTTGAATAALFQQRPATRPLVRRIHSPYQSPAGGTTRTNRTNVKHRNSSQQVLRWNPPPAVPRTRNDPISRKLYNPKNNYSQQWQSQRHSFRYYHHHNHHNPVQAFFQNPSPPRTTWNKVTTCCSTVVVRRGFSSSSRTKIMVHNFHTLRTPRFRQQQHRATAGGGANVQTRSYSSSGRIVPNRLRRPDSHPQAHSHSPPLPPSSGAGSSSSSSSSSTWPYFALASLPALIWFRDTFLDIVRVDGNSMAPTLQPGDWVLVRKADSGILLQSIWPDLSVSLGGGDVVGDDDNDTEDDDNDNHDSDTMDGRKNNTSQESTKSSSPNRSGSRSTHTAKQKQQHPFSFLSSTEVALLRSKIQHYLFLEQNPQVWIHHPGGGFGGGVEDGISTTLTHTHHPQAWWYVKPPLVLPGQVVVIKSPQHFREYHIKRVIAIGGQWLQSPVVSSSQQPSSSSSSATTTTRGSTVTTNHHHPSHNLRLQLIPPYSVHVEGDGSWTTEKEVEGKNSSDTSSVDSRTYGPVSKNCLVGVAEGIVWPPRRWQWLRIARTPQLFGRPRAFWRTSS